MNTAVKPRTKVVIAQVATVTSFAMDDTTICEDFTFGTVFADLQYIMDGEDIFRLREVTNDVHETFPDETFGPLDQQWHRAGWFTLLVVIDDHVQGLEQVSQLCGWQYAQAGGDVGHGTG